MEKRFIFFISLLLAATLLPWFPIENLYAATVDLRHLTFGFYREDWPVIYKDKVLWIDEGVIKGYDFENHQFFNLFPDEQPLTNLYGLVGYDGRFVIYISATTENSYDVSAYDMEEEESIDITDKLGSQWATDYDQKTVIYIDGSPCGKLITYNLSNKTSLLITEHACYAKISGDNIVWAYGDTIYGYSLNKHKQFIVTTKGTHPDIYGNEVVWLSNEENMTVVHLKNIKNGKEKILHQTAEYGITWPATSQRYVVWGKTTEPDLAGVEAVNLITGELFEIQEEDSHQNSVIAPQIEGNIAAWMTWRTGNGDIYAAEIFH